MTTNPPQIVFNHILAFEVSKEQLLIHTLPADEQCAIDNKPQAVRRLIKAEIKRNRNKQLGQMLVVCEATGGYERHVLDAAVEMGLSVHRAHGTRVRHFGGYCGLLAKTDPIDARLLAQYGLKTENIRLYSLPPPETAALRALHARRTEIQQMLIAETGRLDHAQHKSVLKSLKDHIASLKAALAAIEADIAQLSKATAAAPPSTVSAVQAGHRRTRQSRKKLIDVQRQSTSAINKNDLRNFGLSDDHNVATGCRPQTSDCRRHSHPDCRATTNPSFTDFDAF